MATYAETKVLEGFADTLDGLGLSEPIAWPNLPFSRPSSGGYVSLAILPAETTQLTLGASGKNRLRGLCQISVHWPQGQGMVEPTELAGSIIAGFKRGTVITRESMNVRIVRPPYLAGEIQESDWVSIPVSIPFQADVPNPS